MKLERFTYKLAFIWLCFRMVADIIGKMLDGLFKLTANLLQLAVRLALIAAVAAAAWWLWQTFGHKLPL